MITATKTYISEEQNIADIVIENPRVLLILELFDIYIPVKQKTIRELCNDNKISIRLFTSFLNLYLDLSHPSGLDYSFEETPAIIKFLKNTHKYYLEELYPEVKAIIKNMYKDNGHKETALIEKFFNEYFKEVTEHFDYEDDIAFPYMTSLYEHISEKKSFTGPVNYSVSVYRDHHTDIEEKLTDLKNLLVRYLPHDNDQKQRRKLYYCISELDSDLKIHDEIEEKVLIPLIEKMEQHLKVTGE